MATTRWASVDGRGRFDANFESLAMHMVPRDVLGLHRLKGSDAHLQRDARVRHLCEDFRGEVQAGGGRRDRARLPPRVYRLIALAIAGVIVAAEVRRQRQMADGLQVGRRGKIDDAFAFGQNRGDVSGDARDHNFASDARAPARLHPTDPALWRWSIQDQQLQFRFLRQDARRDDSGIIHHAKIAGPQIAGKIDKATVLDGASPAVQHKHARAFPPSRGVSRDELVREMIRVVAEMQAHGFIPARPRRSAR